MPTPSRIFTRKRVASMLCCTRQIVDMIFPTAVLGGRFIPEKTVVEYLNRVAVGIPKVDYIPGLLTEAQAVEGIVLDDSPLTVKHLRQLCNRTRFPLPHYRLTRNIRRLTPGVVEWWRSYIGSGVYTDWRRYTIGAAPYRRAEEA